MAKKAIDGVVGEIVRRFKFRGYSQVSGYKRFGYIRETPNSVIISRENGKDTTIPFKKLYLAVEAIRKDKGIYSGGPQSLREHGITHVNSPVWSLLHMLSLEELTK